MTLNNIGEVHVEMGYYEEALEYCQRALSIANALDDRAEEWVRSAQMSVGIIHYTLGDYEQALTELNEWLAEYPDSEYADSVRQVVERIESGEVPLS